MKKKLANLATSLVAIIVSLLLAEAAFRIAFGIPVFHIENFRFTQAIRDETYGVAGYDPVLGWNMNPHVRAVGNVHLVGTRDGVDTLSTIDYGIRKNKESDDQIRTGAVLVVGSSFAAGSEVTDEDTFPAQLEAMIGKPVVNGAVGGYGVDQIVMRAEQLLPIVKPTVLIADLSSSNITYASYADVGRPKPYYTVEDNRLVLHNSPAPTYVATRNRFEFVKQIAGYSYAINRIMGIFFSDFWYTGTGNTFTRINNDPAVVTCLLFTRFEQEARAAGVARILLSVQHGGEEIQAWNTIPDDLVVAERCARNLGFEVVDEFDIMKTLSKNDPQKFESEYVMESGHILGHKSKYGNEQVAERLAAELANTAPPLRAAPPPATVPLKPLVPGDGINLLTGADDLRPYSSPIARATLRPRDEQTQPFLVEAVGDNGEHYIAVPGKPVDAGPLVLSLEAHTDNSQQVILQIVDAKGTGVLGFFDLDGGVASRQGLGSGHDLTASIDRQNGGWVRLSLGVTMPEPTTPVAIVKLVDSDGGTGFKPAGDTENGSVLVRNLQLEHGQIATPYHPPEK